MLSLRQKLLVGFGGLLLIILLIGVKSIVQVTDLGGAIDSILQQNYRSVLACQEMNEALERMDDGAVFLLLGDRKEGIESIDKNAPDFEKALNIELHNITIPGEREMSNHLKELFLQYKDAIHSLEDKNLSPDTLHRRYFTDLKPLFGEIKDTSDKILAMNQNNMYHESQRARIKAATARHEMYVLLILGAAVAICYVFLIGKWILRPIKRLTQSVDEIRHGNLDLVVKSDSRDEIGRLSDAFNEMTAGIRELRRMDEAKLLRMQHSTQQTFSSLPNAVAIVDLNGKVEISTETAGSFFGLKRGVQVKGLHLKWIADLFQDALSGGLMPEKRERSVVQHFVHAEEHFFQPAAVPILNNWKQMTGVILIINDVTAQFEQDEMKREFLSTVSHQLKTPLTSIRMALHIILEEKIGPINAKQADLLSAAREDSDRLYVIIENLLDINRIESGRLDLNIVPITPGQLVLDAAESFRNAARDNGVELNSALPENLPKVMADAVQIGHVFANLLSNALKYTPAKGKVTLSAHEEKDRVRFLISDTGRGIPAQYLPRIFDRFFRVPGQENRAGTGLGLAIVKEIVEAHDGTVSVESVEGGGSTFSFTLPRADRIFALDKESEEPSWLI